MDSRFRMEVYRPTSRTEVLESFGSDMPLVVPRRGEYIVGIEGPDSQDVLEVESIHHLISWDRASGRTEQKVMVYTKRIPKGGTWGRS